MRKSTTQFRNLLLLSMLVAMSLYWGYRAGTSTAADTKEKAPPMLAHNVFFSLKESNDKNRAHLMEECQKYLANHEGTVYFAAGTVVADLDRPVNDRDWDVGLHLVFQDRECHDKYQVAKTHLEFIERNKDSWSKVRVFDSYVEGAPAK